MSMSPALNRSCTLQHFECDNVVEIRNKIILDFYPGSMFLYPCFRVLPMLERCHFDVQIGGNLHVASLTLSPHPGLLESLP